MKKQIAWVLALALLFTLAACGTQNPEAANPNPPGSSCASKPTMMKPPGLTVSLGKGERYDGTTCTYTWTFDTGRGEKDGICADSPHPLELQELLIPVETTVDAVELQFEVAPQSVSVRCWNDTLFGNSTAESANAALSGNLLELRPGGYVYEVTATWTGENLAAEGTVHYAFYIIKHSVQFAHTHTTAEASQTGDEPVNGYCGNMITKLQIDGKEYAFQGSDSVNLTDLLINLSYDPALVCKCLPEIYVETELGMTYGISLSGYARCDEGQASLTEAQLDLILQILENQT